MMNRDFEGWYCFFIKYANYSINFSISKLLYILNILVLFLIIIKDESTKSQIFFI